jgi:UDP-N-acetylmuramoylalanine--D-glutamate ligase
MNNINFGDKKIGILGFGIENQALAKWLIKHGANLITICDKNPNIKSQISRLEPHTASRVNKIQISNLKFQTGNNYLKNLTDFDIVFRTPGISPLTKELVDAKKNGVKISSQIKLFMDLCPAKTIGITGTKGKGTTSTLIYEIIKNNIPGKLQKDVRFLHGAQASGKRLRPTFFNLPRNIYLGGNIGNAPIEFLDKLTKKDLVVLELSSFQLQDIDKSPNIAVVLDVKEDHLDYHKNRREYIRAKENIVKFQKANDYTVVNLDYLTSFEFAAVSASDNNYYFSRRKSVDLGTYVEWMPKDRNAHFGKLILRTPKRDYEIVKTYDITLRGEHNLENICAAITASYLAGANIESIKKVVPKFPGLEHRLEYAGEINGVKFYNDSFSTNPDTAIAAIKSFSEPIILIAGGSEKNANYSKLGKEIAKSSVKTLISIGDTGPKIIKAISYKPYAVSKKIKIIEKLKNMKDIVKAARNEANSGDVVLLSPASASFGLFKNYKDRGNQFKKEVKCIM